MLLVSHIAAMFHRTRQVSLSLLTRSLHLVRISRFQPRTAVGIETCRDSGTFEYAESWPGRGKPCRIGQGDVGFSMEF